MMLIMEVVPWFIKFKDLNVLIINLFYLVHRAAIVLDFPDIWTENMTCRYYYKNAIKFILFGGGVVGYVYRTSIIET